MSVTLPNGSIQTKRISSVAKFVIFDRGGGCVKALGLIEEQWVVVGDTCKTHGADLLCEDISKPFKVHVKSVHEGIVWITSHDVPYGIFSSYPGVRALLSPAPTRFVTEVICVGSVLADKPQLQRLVVDVEVEEWVQKQPKEVKQKFRSVKANYLSDEWWHKTEVFVAVTEPVQFSLRCLDTGTPNLKDAAFAFEQLTIEFGAPLLGKLAEIKDWGDIDLQLDLHSEFMGNLASYVKAMLRKRRDDWLSPLVLASAAVNPIYTYSTNESELWTVKGGDGAVRAIFDKFFWGDDDGLLEAITGWNRCVLHTPHACPAHRTLNLYTLRDACPPHAPPLPAPHAPTTHLTRRRPPQAPPPAPHAALRHTPQSLVAQVSS